MSDLKSRNLPGPVPVLQKCYFLDLPPELRLPIYEHILGDCLPYEKNYVLPENGLCYRWKIERELLDNWRNPGIIELRTMLRCCRTVHQEAQGILRKKSRVLISVRGNIWSPPYDTNFLGNVDYFIALKHSPMVAITITPTAANNRDFIITSRLLRALDKCKFVRELHLTLILSSELAPSLGKIGAFMSLFEDIECEGVICTELFGPSAIRRWKNLNGAVALRAAVEEICGGGIST